MTNSKVLILLAACNFMLALHLINCNRNWLKSTFTYVKENTLQAEWDNITRGLKCPWSSKATQRATTLVDRLRDGWQHLLRDRATRSLSYNDEQFHVLERIKVTETGRRLKILLDLECIPAITQRSESLADWYKMAQTVYLQSQILDKDIDNYETTLESFSYRLFHESKEQYDNILHEIDKLPGKLSTLERPNVLDNGNVKKWRNICDIQEQISFILQENNQLVDELDTLSIMDVFDNNDIENSEFHL